MQSTPPVPTPTELRGRRLALGLPRAALGALLGVTAEEARNLERTRRWHVRPDHEPALRALEREAAAFVDEVARARPVFAMAYEADETFAEMAPALFARLRHSDVHLVALAQAREMLADEGHTLTVVGYAPKPYADWLERKREADSPAMRLGWCAAQAEAYRLTELDEVRGEPGPLAPVRGIGR